MVRKDSKSLKVFIVFTGDIYLQPYIIENIGFVVNWMADLKGKKVLVTGGAGFIGYHLCSKLSTLTDDLTIYDNFSSGQDEKC